MSGTFYIASSRDGLADVLRLTEVLEAAGMRNSFAWPAHFTHTCSSETCGVADRPDLSRREIEAAGGCDLFVGIARLGKGSHVELGAALRGAAGRVILVGVDRLDSVFYVDGRVEHASDLDEVIRLIAGQRHGARS